MSIKKVLVTGSSGMLGTDVVLELEKRKINVKACSTENFDLTNIEQLNGVVAEFSPTHIINCAAYTDVDGAEKNREDCFKVNVEGVRHLVKLAKAHSFRLIQISTDYVFSGDKEEYRENDNTGPINYYGLTKLQAEEVIKKELRDYLIVRTAWLFGKNGKNFVNTIAKLARNKEELSVVSDQFGSPTYTFDLAKCLIDLLEEDTGVYHVTNDGVCSWYEFASEIVGRLNISCNIKPCLSNEYYREAVRPKYSVLKNSKIDSIRSWQEALAAYLITI